jgi:hypothetical protein
MLHQVAKKRTDKEGKIGAVFSRRERRRGGR